MERICGDVEGLTAQFGRFADAHNSAVEKIFEVVTPMVPAFRGVVGWVMEVKQEADLTWSKLNTSFPLYSQEILVSSGPLVCGGYIPAQISWEQRGQVNLAESPPCVRHSYTSV